MARKGAGAGLRVTSEGYVEITRRGPLRGKKAHRAYVDRQLAESGLPPLIADTEIHHLCRRRDCWPPTDFHLLIMPAAMHHFMEAGARPTKFHRKKQRERNEREFVYAESTERAEDYTRDRAGDIGESLSLVSQ